MSNTAPLDLTTGWNSVASSINLTNLQNQVDAPSIGNRFYRLKH